MIPKPGEVWRIDLGLAGKVRLVVLVSRYDPDSPRALVLCVPLTTQYRGSLYEVKLGKLPFLREVSYANVQGTQAVAHHELQTRVGNVPSQLLQEIRKALAYILEL